MLSIVDNKFPPRDLPERRRSSCSLPASPFLILNSLTSNRFPSYNKLSQEPLKLTVHKLDGSSFEVEVTKSATVLELKKAVESVFTRLEHNGPTVISWTHVWGHFCLCYDGHKLLIEKDQIRNYGIKDGDQLHFIRHRSVNYNPMKKRSNRKQYKQELVSFSRPDSNGDKEQNYIEDENGGDQVNVDSDPIIGHEPRVANFLTRWFSYSRLSTSNSRSVSMDSGLRYGIKSFLRMYSDKPCH